MRIELDEPLDFEKAKCDICFQQDDDWLLMQFLADGDWRTLKRGVSLRAQGIDNAATSRLYVIHACTEPVMRTFISLEEVQTFFSTLQEGY